MFHGPLVRVEVTRTHLELLNASALQPSRAPSGPVRLEWTAPITPARYRLLYSAVGQRWHWGDRLTWSDVELQHYLASPAIQVWVLQVEATDAGFFELKLHHEGHAEIMYFGLSQKFIGCGLGGWMLTRAAQESFALGATRVILNTCTLDAPQALPNYIARGFKVIREERYETDIPGVEP